jgi:type IV secretory pathway TraG/TraD family ATPase VirD4
MSLNSNKNSHPAASGRFASYGEIVSNFSGELYRQTLTLTPKQRPKCCFENFLTPDTAVSRRSFYYFAAVSLISLPAAVIITLMLNAALGLSAPIHPFLLSGEYLVLWVILFFIIIFARRIFKCAGSGAYGLNGHGCRRAVLSPGDKSFRLGILKGGGGKKYPDVLIGLDRIKRFEHTLVISPTGGGKTSRYIIPGIAADAGYSGISVFAIDIDSPYLYESVKNEWLGSGKTVIFFDPYGADAGGRGGSGSGCKTASFNPLIDKEGNALSDAKLLNISSMLFHLDKNEIKGGDVHAHKYYSKRSSDLFYACLMYLKYRYGAKYFDLFTVKAFLERGVKFIESEVEKFKEEKAGKIKNLFNNFLELPVYERAKVVTDVLNNLDFLSGDIDANRFKCKKENDCFCIDDFFTGDTLFIAGIPKEKINSGGGRLMSFLTQIFIGAIYENRRKSLNGENEVSGAERSFFIYLDEFPALTLNDFDVELANLRKTNTGVCMTAQDISFLKDRYGDISLIASNIGTHIVMGHAGWETCKYYSEMSGEKYVFHKEPVRKNINPALLRSPSGLSSEVNETPVASGLYPLISPGELKNMSRDSVFIYSKYVNPFILELE